MRLPFPLNVADHRFSGRDSLIFLVDASKAMFEPYEDEEAATPFDMTMQVRKAGRLWPSEGPLPSARSCCSLPVGTADCQRLHFVLLLPLVFFTF